MISSDQIRAAKAILRWSGEELAQRAGVSLSTIRRVESSMGVHETQNMMTLVSIKKALEEGGVEFIGTPDDRPGVRLK